MTNLRTTRAGSGPVLWILAIVLSASGTALMWLVPAGTLGFDAGQLGGTLLPLGVLTGLLALATARSDASGAASFGEKLALVGLAVSLVSAVYLFVWFQRLGWDVDYNNRQIRSVITNVVTLVIIAAVIVSSLRRRERARTLEDERDGALRNRAASVAHGVLLILLAIFVVSVGFEPFRWLPLTTPTSVANGIIFVILLAEVVRHGAETWLYRRDRA